MDVCLPGSSWRVAGFLLSSLGVSFRCPNLWGVLLSLLVYLGCRGRLGKVWFSCHRPSSCGRVLPLWPQGFPGLGLAPRGLASCVFLWGSLPAGILLLLGCWSSLDVRGFPLFVSQLFFLRSSSPLVVGSPRFPGLSRDLVTSPFLFGSSLLRLVWCSDCGLPVGVLLGGSSCFLPGLGPLGARGVRPG